MKRFPLVHENPTRDFDKVEQEVERIDSRKTEVEYKNKLACFGICWNCGRFNYRKTRYGKEEAWCEPYEGPRRPLSGSDPVVECSNHHDKFALSLSAMWAIALPISADKPRKAGFMIEEEQKDDRLEKDKAL